MGGDAYEREMLDKCKRTLFIATEEIRYNGWVVCIEEGKDLASISSIANPDTMRTVVLIGSACMALLVLGIRMRAAKKPTNLMKIIMPPVGMATGFLMFLVPQTHIPWLYALGAILVGILFSIPLIRTSRFEVRDGAIYLQRSKAFVFILLGLLVVRLSAHGWIGEYMSLPQTGAIFYLLAFSMLAPWRIAMLQRFTKMRKEVS